MFGDWRRAPRRGLAPSRDTRLDPNQAKGCERNECSATGAEPRAGDWRRVATRDSTRTKLKAVSAVNVRRLAPTAARRAVNGGRRTAFAVLAGKQWRHTSRRQTAAAGVACAEFKLNRKSTRAGSGVYDTRANLSQKITLAECTARNKHSQRDQTHRKEQLSPIEQIRTTIQVRTKDNQYH